MPIAKFEMPDGRIARFEVPEGTSPEQAQQMIQAQISAPSTTANAESASTQLGRQTPREGQIAATLGKGLTLGFADELAGLMNAYGKAAAPAMAMPGQAVPNPADQDVVGAYLQGRDVYRGATKQLEKEYPIGAPLTEAAGSLPLLAVPGLGGISTLRTGAKMIGPMRAAGTAALSGLKTGLAGGLGGSEATDVSGALADTAIGGAMGGAFGGIGSGIGSGVKNVVGAVSQRVSPTAAMDFARQKLAQALERDVPSGSVFERSGALSTPAGRGVARLETLGPAATIADVGGSSTRALADVLAQLPGKAPEMFSRLVTERQATRPSRLVSAADEALATMGLGVKATEQALIDTQKKVAGPLYDKLKNVTFPIDEELQAILQAAEKAHGGAELLAKLRREAGIDLSKLGVGDSVSFKAVDNVKKALFDLGENAKRAGEKELGRAYDDLRVDLVKKLDVLSPKDANGSIYAQARAAFAGPAEVKDALTKGRDIFKEDILELPTIMSSMTPSENTGFRIGVLQAIRDKVGTEAGQTQLLKMWKEPKTGDRLREVFGDDFRKFATEVQKEGVLKKLESVVGGSPTFKRAAAAADLGVDTAMEAGSAASSAASGNIAGAVQSAKKLFGRLEMPESVRNQLAKLLTLKGEAAKEELRNLEQMIQNTNIGKETRARIAGALLGMQTPDIAK